MIVHCKYLVCVVYKRDQGVLYIEYISVSMFEVPVYFLYYMYSYLIIDILTIYVLYVL
jgi:hypothetical protein